MVQLFIAVNPDRPPKPYVPRHRGGAVMQLSEQMCSTHFRPKKKKKITTTKQDIPRSSRADFLRLQWHFFVTQVEMLAKYIAFFWGIFY